MTQVGEAAAPESTETGGAEAQTGPDFGPLLERMDQFGSQLGEVREQVGQFQPPEPQQQPEPQYGQPGQQQYGQPQYGGFPQQPFQQEQFGGEPQYDPSQGQVLYDQFGNPVEIPGAQQQQVDPQQAAQQLASVLGLPDLQSEVAQMRAHRDAEMLKGRYPDFADPEKFQAIHGAVQQRAMAVARGDEEFAQRLMSGPEFWEDTYLAGRARDSAAAETPAGGADAIQLETPGGTTPERAELDEGDLIVAAMDKRRPQW